MTGERSDEFLKTRLEGLERALKAFVKAKNPEAKGGELQPIITHNLGASETLAVTLSIGRDLQEEIIKLMKGTGISFANRSDNSLEGVTPQSLGKFMRNVNAETRTILSHRPASPRDATSCDSAGRY